MITNANIVAPETVPGLALRARAALAHVRHRIDPDGANEEMLAVCESAEFAGYQAHRARVFTAPLMIATDAHLLLGWESGQRAAAEYAEILARQHCRQLINDNPCPDHGA